MAACTRSDYMSGKCSHATYYAQFVNANVLCIVAQRIGKDRIKNSKDEHFNDIPLHEWDALHSAVLAARNRFPHGDACFVSLGNSVCIAKEAARQIRANQP